MVVELAVGPAIVRVALAVRLQVEPEHYRRGLHHRHLQLVAQVRWMVLELVFVLLVYSRITYHHLR